MNVQPVYPAVCPLIKDFTVAQVKIRYALRKMDPKPIGAENADRVAWWRYGFQEAAKVQEQIANGTFKPVESPEIYRDDGGINLNYFL